MDAGGLLQIARGIVDKVAMPLAITLGPKGGAKPLMAAGWNAIPSIIIEKQKA